MLGFLPTPALIPNADLEICEFLGLVVEAVGGIEFFEVVVRVHRGDVVLFVRVQGPVGKFSCRV